MAIQPDRISSRELLKRGREELYEGDVREACAKGWKAAAQMVKAVAASRGWEHQDHAALYQVVEQLVTETGDASIDTFFAVAIFLETNYHENWAPAVSVDRDLEDIELFLDKLEPLVYLNPGG